MRFLWRKRKKTNFPKRTKGPLVVLYQKCILNPVEVVKMLKKEHTMAHTLDLKNLQLCIF